MAGSMLSCASSALCLFPDKAAGFSESPRIVGIAYCQVTPLHLENEAREAAILSEARNIATAAIGQRFGMGQVNGEIQAIVIAVTCSFSRKFDLGPQWCSELKPTSFGRWPDARAIWLRLFPALAERDYMQSGAPHTREIVTRLGALNASSPVVLENSAGPSVRLGELHDENGLKKMPPRVSVSGGHFH